jgi:hypothetical protein
MYLAIFHVTGAKAEVEEKISCRVMLDKRSAGLQALLNKATWSLSWGYNVDLPGALALKTLDPIVIVMQMAGTNLELVVLVVPHGIVVLASIYLDVPAPLQEHVLPVATNRTGIIITPTAAGRTRAIMQRTSVAEPARRAREPPASAQAIVRIAIRVLLLDTIFQLLDHARRPPVRQISIQAEGA